MGLPTCKRAGSPRSSNSRRNSSILRERAVVEATTLPTSGECESSIVLRRLHQDCVVTVTDSEDPAHPAGARCELCERLGSDESPSATRNNETDSGDYSRSGERYRDENYRGERTKRADIVACSRSELDDNRSLRCASSVVRWNSKAVHRFSSRPRSTLLWVAVIVLTVIATAASTQLPAIPQRNSRDSSSNAKREGKLLSVCFRICELFFF